MQEMHNVIQHNLVHDHPCLKEIQSLLARFKSRPSVLAIAVIDCSVKQRLQRDTERLGLWNKVVVKTWFESSNESPSEFLRRANKFLREEFKDVFVPQEAVIDTGSYVMFITISSLASLMLFQHLEMRKLGCIKGT